MDDGDREDLAEVSEELATALRDLRDELEADRRRGRGRGRGPLGLPRPPSGRELLKFTDEVAIPAVIAILEANIKVLEAVRRGIRVAETERYARERTREAGSDAADRATDVGRRTLERLEDGLSDLRDVVDGDAVPEDRVGSDLLDEIDRLEAEVQDRIDEARRTREGTRDRRDRRSDDGRRGDRDRDGGDRSRDDRDDRDGRRRPRRNRRRDSNGGRRSDENEDDEDGVPVDVDAELDSLRKQYGQDDEDDEE